ncbi:MAG: ASKHA domain-containing protein [Elusimicrobiota bacterium]|nr:ASKHA domain-containing protein [Elusimicrobiota bacterium]
MNSFKVKVLSLNKEIEVAEGQDLLQAMIKSGVNIFASCGGKGVCGKCKIKIVNGNFVTKFSQFISEEEKQQNIVLACETQPLSDIVVELLNPIDEIKKLKDVFITSSYFDKHNLEKKLVLDGFDISPIAKMIHLNLPSPSIEDYVSDTDRLVTYVSQQEKLKVIIDDYSVVKTLPEILRVNNWNITVVLVQKYLFPELLYEICEVRKEKRNLYAIAVDVGTTTIVVTLLNITDFKILGSVCSINKQITFGADIITRIVYSEETSGLEMLNQKVLETINELIYYIIAENGVDLRDIYAVVFAGNTTMIHFLLNLPAKYIRREPYVPVVNRPPVTVARQLGLMINPEARVYCLPLVASYIGGDIVGGVVSCQIDVSDDICVLLDLGTNGEIVVGNKDFLVAAACSCGPAFEGIDISSGMLAVEGAIEDVKIVNGRVDYKVIGNTKPIGICGSGLIGLPAELYKAGIIDRSGKFNKSISEPQLQKRIRQNEIGENEFILVGKEHTGNNRDIVISESDIQNILRSKGAIFHGLHTLLKYLHLSFSDIKKIFICGGFGSYIDIKKAQILGLLPDIEESKFVVAGNTSLLGAILYTLSQSARDRIYKTQQKMTYIDLSSMSMYMNEYSSTLFIPHTDLSLFPNVTKYLSK